MSLDYFYYEELRRRKNPGAWWWVVGDRLYYLGLVPALLALPYGLLAGVFGFGWHRVGVGASVFVVSVAVWYLGGSLKKHAYTLGEQGGISVVDLWIRGARPLSDEQMFREHFSESSVAFDIVTGVRRIFAEHTGYPADRLWPDQDVAFRQDVDTTKILRDVAATFGLMFTDEEITRTPRTIRAVSLLVAEKRRATAGG